MSTFLVAMLSFGGFIVAYHTYGKYLAKKIFKLDSEALVPSREFEDGVDYVPSKRSIVFGHHFTSIAGTGPIVGPAIAVFWGWLPALLWVVFGSIFIGAVHDLGSLVVSLRNRGQTIGEVAGKLINFRARILFLLILFFSLTVVLAIFGLVIATIFKNYPETVLPVWISLPLAMVIGVLTYRYRMGLLTPSLISLAIIYGSLYWGVEFSPVSVIQTAGTSAASWTGQVDVQIGGRTVLEHLPLINPVMAWTAVLMVYCFFASVLPVWLLLQPRDYINAQQLFVALGLLVVGLMVAGLTNQANLWTSAPAIASGPDELPLNPLAIVPFLFVTVACGACSGFHCLVSSGTSSKQLSNEKDALFVGYGSMLMEGALAVIVILACTAGVGMGLFEKDATGRYVQQLDEHQQPIVGQAAWRTRYSNDRDWSSFGMDSQIAAFVEGGANFLYSIGLPRRFGVGIIATLVACFAATTLDSATRLQRYVIQELGVRFRLKPVANKYSATVIAVMLGLALALMPAPGKAGVFGTGGLLLWPLFGATNQLLAGLSFLVISFYLWRRKLPIGFVVIPMIFMMVMPTWALALQIVTWQQNQNWLLLGLAVATLALQIWMVVEALILFPAARGVIESPEAEPAKSP